MLDGALALALPVGFGQFLEVRSGSSPGVLTWRSFEPQAGLWFEAIYNLPDLLVLKASDAQTAQTLRAMLLACRAQVPDFLTDCGGLAVDTRTNFPRAWGLGTSSTLLAALGKWSGADPYRVLVETLGGSGYDLACAYAEGPLLFRLAGGAPEVRQAAFHPPFTQHLCFVFLNQKQNSREGIAHYREKVADKARLAGFLSTITWACLEARTLRAFEALLVQHEKALSEALGLPRVQERLFPHFPGVVKSLGAWGGDFVLAASAASEAETRAWFAERGYRICLNWQQMTEGPEV